MDNYELGGTNKQLDSLRITFSQISQFVNNKNYRLCSKKALKQYNNTQINLDEIKKSDSSFLSTFTDIFKPETKDKGFLVVIIMFAFLGDIVPILISLKNQNKNLLITTYENSVNWFHEVVRITSKFSLIPLTLKAIYGFLFGDKSFKKEEKNSTQTNNGIYEPQTVLGQIVSICIIEITDVIETLQNLATNLIGLTINVFISLFFGKEILKGETYNEWPESKTRAVMAWIKFIVKFLILILVFRYIYTKNPNIVSYIYNLIVKNIN